MLNWINFIYFCSVESNEKRHKELIEKKEVEISELNAKLRTQETEKQSEIIKLQLEVSMHEFAKFEDASLSLNKTFFFHHSEINFRRR